jgi:hypothetical protein
MKTLIYILIWGVSLSGLFMIYWFMMMNHRYKVFMKNVSEGDMVNVYINDEKVTGEVLHIGEIYVDVFTIYGKDRVQRTDIYPLLGYCYKK